MVCQFSSSFFFFLLTITRFGRRAEIRWSICISKSQRNVFVSFSRTNSMLCIYHLIVVKWNRGQMKMFCTIPYGLPSQPIRLLRDWSFHYYYHITYIYYFLLYYYYYYYCSCCYYYSEFVTSAVTGGFTLESPHRQNSFKYPSWF